MQSWKNPESIAERKTTTDFARALAFGIFRAIAYMTVIVPVLEFAAFSLLNSKSPEVKKNKHG